jgi:hypothetical protein
MTVQKPAFSSDLSPRERKRLVHSMRVQFPGRTAIIEALEKCLEESAYSAEPKCLFVGGMSGVGKSSVIETFYAKYPRVPRGEADRIRVLVVSIPAPATVKGTVSAALEALGDPMAHTGVLSKMTARLFEFLDRNGVEMIIFDEFQHLIDSDSRKVLGKVSDWIKTLVIGAKRPIVLVGLPEAEIILDANPQLRRRFPRREHFGRFRWDTAERRAEFRMLLRTIESCLPFLGRSDLDAPETAEWFFDKTEGTLGLVMMLVREAAELAIDRGADHVARSDLEAAFAQMHSKVWVDAKSEAKQKRKVGRGSRNVGEQLRA